MQLIINFKWSALNARKYFLFGVLNRNLYGVSCHQTNIFVWSALDAGKYLFILNIVHWMQINI
jgi:hypothetical protein